MPGRPQRLRQVHLLKIAAGLLPADSGTRFVQPGATVRYLPRVPAAMSLPDGLSRLREEKSHLALVTADDGAVCAMVTLEDLVEDLLGTVRDGTHRG